MPASARLMLRHACMHAIFFGLKRAWHGTLRTTRHALAVLGLTAARFDLLYVVHTHGTMFPPTQRRLRETLGVNRTTVSRMLGSLEELGLITRERPRDGDQRTLLVRLTVQGRRRIRVAINRLIRRGAAQLALDSAVAGLPGGPAGGSWVDDTACFEATAVLESFLRGIRDAFRDSATLHYAWHPDD